VKYTLSLNEKITENVSEQGAEENIFAYWTEVTGRWLKLLNMELSNLYSSISSIMVIKVRIR
jgi:hypothetical protein